MQRLKAVEAVRRSSFQRFSSFSNLKRGFSSLPNYAQTDDVFDQASGRAFCSGADVIAPYHFSNEDPEAIVTTLYLDKEEKSWLNVPDRPNDSVEVALLDGIMMRGGAGITLPGMFKVVTDGTATVWLSGSSCSSVRHYSLNARLGGIEERLGKMITDGPSVIESSLAAFGDLVYPPKVTSFRQFRLLITGAFFPSTVLSSAPSSLFRLSPIASTLDATARCFSHDTVEEILEALEREAAESYDEWYSSTLKLL
ncbi:3-hydroxyisobutyryl-CoA hydrolase-like protein 2, mitochondrial [Cucurbita argyrosperma subsp. argyrosperma]|nr:3-hydroxyisobutyryl-CoA hydrolase-like protein 2, mitochondrial [Cucurbita argyrosperma subsp. argyrosperma]